MTKTFKPVIHENQILAGGMRIAIVDDNGQLVFEDRYRNSCLARGTGEVRVDIEAFLDELMRFFGEKP